MSTSLEQEIAKIKYQLKELRGAVDLDKHPMAGSIIDYDLGEAQVRGIHDVFSKADESLEAGKTVMWGQFEQAIEEVTGGLGYQSLKMITIHLHVEGSWKAVCEAYAAAKPCLEFDSHFGRKKIER